MDVRWISLASNNVSEKTAFLQTEQGMKKNWIKEKQNIWKACETNLQYLLPAVQGTDSEYDEGWTISICGQGAADLTET